jgi:hypothetical protein
MINRLLKTMMTQNKQSTTKIVGQSTKVMKKFTGEALNNYSQLSMR